MTVGRNEPCPCGSGKKYKKCCLGKDNATDKPTVPFDEAPNAEDADGNPIYKKLFPGIPGLSDLLGDEPLDLGADFKSEITRARAQEKRGVEGDFLGLPAAALYAFRLADFRSFEDFVKLTVQPGDARHLDTPIITTALHLLERLDVEGGVASDDDGNLPLSIVLDIHHRVLTRLFPDIETDPKTEEESLHVVRVRTGLQITQLISDRGRRFSLTEKGRETLRQATEQRDASRLYESLLRLFLKEFNWRFLTCYSEAANEIQINAMFNLYMLRKKAKTWINGNQLADRFIRAFPAAVEKSIADRPEEFAESEWDGELQIRDAFCKLFLEMFCRYFGFLEGRPASRASERTVWDALELRTTDLFAATFKWHV
jgi:hypothetical protein